MPKVVTADKDSRTYFREVTDYVCSVPVDLSENVEDERLHIKVERLVVQEELG